MQWRKAGPTAGRLAETPQAFSGAAGVSEPLHPFQTLV
ncbi:hypothetical protein BV133_242 [Blastochloris viridis]|uniref:Uncharacterized protein n=1 Tax=Blastochloris viridis TaxID=1079 RepID=A0A182CXC6_BLAVI|nr:hypothetical protein BV133_242 [Blastochloris viridis]